MTLDRHERKQILKKSKRQEDRTADTYRGSRNSGSGNGWLRKNDVRSDKILFENKFTTATKSISLKSSDLKELTERAILDDRVAVLQFDLAGRRYVVLNEDDFLEMIHDSDQ